MRGVNVGIAGITMDQRDSIGGKDNCCFSASLKQWPPSITADGRMVILIVAIHERTTRRG